MGPRAGLAGWARVALFFLFVVGAPGVAQAGFAQRLELRAEFGVGTMLPDYQRNALGYLIDVEGSGRFGISIVDWLAVQVSYSGWYFPSNRGDGQIHALSGGVRLQPRVGRVGRFFADVHFGPGWTPSRWRPYLDFAIGFEFTPTPWLWVGPFARYGHLFALSPDYPSDAQFWAAGVSVTFRPGHVNDRRREREARDRDRRDREEDERRRDRDRAREREAARDKERERDRERDRDRERNKDGDHDGVRDAVDRCPEVAAGAHPDPDRAGCPDGDSDEDGVRDHADRCPKEPDGHHPDPQKPGCPLPDRDGDNVPDLVDACPTKAGSPSPDKKRNGCPGLVRLERGQLRILEPVYFAPGKDRILPRSFPVLQAIADALRANEHIRRISVDGHTDETGGPAGNMDLSRRRAESVRVWLGAHKIEGSRIETRGYGETRPVIPGTSPKALAANRRVEFRIVDAGGKR